MSRRSSSDLTKFLTKWDIDSKRDKRLIRLLEGLPSNDLQITMANFCPQRWENYKPGDHARALKAFVRDMKNRK